MVVGESGQVQRHGELDQDVVAVVVVVLVGVAVLVGVCHTLRLSVRVVAVGC